MTAAGPCFHCGEPVAPGRGEWVRVAGEERAMCCPGCAAAALLIENAGLADYYRWRSEKAPRPEQQPDDLWSSYDRADLAHLLLVQGDGTTSVNLMIEGMRCAACGWLIESRLGQLAGVREVALNPATARARVVFGRHALALSALLRAVAALGYRPHVLGADDTLEVATRERRTALKRLAVAGFGMMQVMMIAVALYSGAWDGMDPVIRAYLRITSLIVTTPVLLYAGAPFLNGAWRSLAARSLGMDVPVALGIVLAYVASAWNTLLERGEVYFDSVVMFIFLLLLGRYVEMLARHRAGSMTEALVRLVPATALRVTAAGEERVPVAALGVGDRIRVASGDTIPADGRLCTPHTLIDESLLSGESEPVTRRQGEALVAGSTNLTSPALIEVTAVGAQTVLAGIVRLLERAQSERPRLARMADRAAAWFVTRVLLGATLVAVAWAFIDPARAFPATLSVLVVTCPCALSLATPTAITAATAYLARRGLLLTRADALEVLASADHLLIDKTGTLTLGRPTLERVTTTGHADAAACQRLAAALEQGCAHPWARAFATVATTPAETAETAVLVAGRGVSGRIAGREVRIGSAEFVAELAGARPLAVPEDGVHLGDGAGWLAHFALSDALRPGAGAALAAFRRLGFRVELASGDHARAVAPLAAQLGIEAFSARMSPQDKLARLGALRGAGAKVLAIGDGINDAPCLQAAHVSIAMGSGSSLAQTSADLVCMSRDLAPLPLAVEVARRTQRIVRQNLAWAAAYNLISLPLAALGWVAPWAAALGMSVSSLVVVLNALRLTRAPMRATRARAALAAHSAEAA